MDTDLRTLPYTELHNRASKLAEYMNTSTVPLHVRGARLTEYEALLDELSWRADVEHGGEVKAVSTGQG